MRVVQLQHVCCLHCPAEISSPCRERGGNNLAKQLHRQIRWERQVAIALRQTADEADVWQVIAIAQRSTEDPHFSHPRDIQADREPHQTRLTTPVVAAYGHHFTWLDAQIHPPEEPTWVGTETKPHIVELEWRR